MANRTTADLIEELHSEAAGADHAALLVGFEKHTEFIFSHMPKREAVETLNTHIRNGGEPVGIGRVRAEEGEATVSMRPLEEYEGEEWVEKYLLTMRGEMMRAIHRGEAPGMRLPGQED